VSIRISVIVPVFNPAGYLQPLLDSLDRQTLPRDEFEAIFVDDGSSDGTGDALDEWTKHRSHTRVIHQPNHGWPGQPRNVGIDLAQGTYVYFVDQDDWLGDEALARLVAYADINASDVVVGKMKGIRRGVPVELFKSSVPKAVIGETPLQGSLTPHKVFRRAFLDEIGLRFPEGRRRLEDHLFVTTAYLRASVVSVYSDYDCYMHISRDDGGNAAFRPFKPSDYYGNLEEVLDVVDRFIPEGDVKDRFLQRWVRGELVGRLRSRFVQNMARTDQEAYFLAISQILQKRIPISAIRLLPFEYRLSAILARHTPAAEFFRVEASLKRVVAMAGLVEGPRIVSIRLFDNIRPLGAQARLSDVLATRADSSLTRAVIEEFGDDPELLPPTSLRVGDAAEDTHLQRVNDSERYASSLPLQAGQTIRLLTPLGQRSATLFTGSWIGKRVGFVTSRVTRRLRRYGARAARKLLGARTVDRLRGVLHR